jgi:hypothetical protein
MCREAGVTFRTSFGLQPLPALPQRRSVHFLSARPVSNRGLPDLSNGDAGCCKAPGITEERADNPFAVGGVAITGPDSKRVAAVVVHNRAGAVTIAGGMSFTPKHTTELIGPVVTASVDEQPLHHRAALYSRGLVGRGRRSFAGWLARLFFVSMRRCLPTLRVRANRHGCLELTPNFGRMA